MKFVEHDTSRVRYKSFQNKKLTVKYLFVPIQDFPSVATFFPLGHVQTPPSRELLQSCSQLSEVHNVVAAIKMVKINAILTPLEKLRVS